MIHWRDAKNHEFNERLRDFFAKFVQLARDFHLSLISFVYLGVVTARSWDGLPYRMI
jgi:hypothetical protein